MFFSRFKRNRRSLILLLYCSVASACVFAQKNNPLVNSGEVIKEGVTLHEDAKYKQAIEKFRQVSRSDTNYADILYELSLSCYADSQMTAAHQYAEQGMKLYPERFTSFALLDGNALDNMERSADAKSLYDEAIRRNPNSSLLLFNRAITLLKQKETLLARNDLQLCLLTNPYFASAHYLLGNMYYEEGNMVAAMLCYSAYLVVSPGGKYNKSIVQKLNDMAKVTDDILENARKYKAGKTDNFELQQQILLSKIALDKKYKLKAELEDNIVRQIQVVMEKIEYAVADKGFCTQYYVPLFNRLFSEGFFEPLVFYMFSGLELKNVENWNNRNKKAINAFVSEATSYLNDIRSTRTLALNERKAAPVYYYFNEGKFVGKGPYRRSGEKIIFTGGWEFFDDAGNLTASGDFDDQEKKKGLWQYYYDNGKPKKKINYVDDVLEGLYEGWFINGNKWYSETYKAGKLEGLRTSYYYNGNLRSTVEYKNDLKEGQEKNYSSTGILTSIIHYQMDKREGKAISYFSNGKLQDEVDYKAGKAQGPYRSFYKSGARYQEGEFSNDLRQGPWTSYYEDGGISEKTTYTDNEITGEFTEYYENGKLSQKGNYTKKKIDGKFESYDDDGVKYHDAIYDKGRLREINFFDKSGKNIYSTTTRKGAADITFYSAEGLKTGEGFFNRDGAKEGKFTEYFSSGIKSEEAFFKDGVLHGPSTAYYNNGQHKIERNYTNGEEDGYVKSYFYNGRLSNEGWVVEGLRQQQTIYYNSIGDTIQKHNYLDDELHGYSEYLYPGNIPNMEYRYYHGWLEEITQFDSTGKVISENRFLQGSGPLVYKHYNGKVSGSGRIEHNMLTGEYKSFFFDGSLRSVSYYVNDELDSTYVEYFYGGTLRTAGKYDHGNKTGVWKWYYASGSLREEMLYKDNMLSGIDKLYNEDGSFDKTLVYKKDKLNGEYKSFGDNNQLAVLMYFKDDVLQGYSYEDKSGKLVPMIPMKGASGKLKSFYKNGTASAEIDFLDNDVQGIRKFYYTNGKVFVDGRREFGYDQGVKRVYSLTGTLLKEQNYVLGNLHGPSKTYHPNGKIKSEESYYNDQLHGISRYFNAEGKLKQTCTYFYNTLLSAK